MPLQGEYEPSPSDWVRDQVETIERSGGTEGTTMQGKPVVLVTNLGAKSGKVRKTPLMRVEHDGAYALVGSKGGAPEDPYWVANIKAHPEVTVRDATEVWDMTVREITGDERAAWWDRAVEAWPDYASYATKTDRLIPVFLAERS